MSTKNRRKTTLPPEANRNYMKTRHILHCVNPTVIEWEQDKLITKIEATEAIMPEN